MKPCGGWYYHHLVTYSGESPKAASGSECERISSNLFPRVKEEGQGKERRCSKCSGDAEHSSLHHLLYLILMASFSLHGQGLRLDTAAEMETQLAGLDPLKIEEIHLGGNTIGVDASVALAKFLSQAINIKVRAFYLVASITL